MKKNILFVCVFNSMRSQISEGYMNALFGDRFKAESAGLEPGSLSSLAVEVMALDGIDISKHKSKSVMAFYMNGTDYDYVITVCDAANSGRCPVLPNAKKVLNWTFDDPSFFSGTRDEVLKRTVVIRDQIKNKIIDFASKEK